MHKLLFWSLFEVDDSSTSINSKFIFSQDRCWVMKNVKDYYLWLSDCYFPYSVNGCRTMMLIVLLIFLSFVDFHIKRDQRRKLFFRFVAKSISWYQSVLFVPLSFEILQLVLYPFCHLRCCIVNCHLFHICCSICLVIRRSCCFGLLYSYIDPFVSYLLFFQKLLSFYFFVW